MQIWLSHVAFFSRYRCMSQARGALHTRLSLLFINQLSFHGFADCCIRLIPCWDKVGESDHKRRCQGRAQG